MKLLRLQLTSKDFPCEIAKVRAIFVRLPMQNAKVTGLVTSKDFHCKFRKTCPWELHRLLRKTSPWKLLRLQTSPRKLLRLQLTSKDFPWEIAKATGYCGRLPLTANIERILTYQSGISRDSPTVCPGSKIECFVVRYFTQSYNPRAAKLPKPAHDNTIPL